VNVARDPDQPQWELYDVASDLGEEKDLAGEQPERVAQMIRDWRAWNGEMREPVFR
jgi:hypothetical protein